MKNIKSVILTLALGCAASAIVAEDQLVTIYRGTDKLASFRSFDIAKMVIESEPSVYPVNEAGERISTINSWGVTDCTAIFAVDPKDLMEKYTPTYYINGCIEPYEHDGEVMEIDREKGLVYIHFSSPRRVGSGTVSVSIGEGSEEETASLDVLVQPSFQSVSFYGETASPDIMSMPYLNERPKLGLLSMYWALNCEKTIDVNSEDEVRVAMNIFGGNMDDIVEAVKCYDWELVSGDALVVTKDEYEIVENNGFDAILGVRSGIKTGDVVFRCNTPCIDYWGDENPSPISLTLTYHVVDIKKTHPVRDITVSDDNIEMDMGYTEIVTVGVVPGSSWFYQVPTVSVADPEIVRVEPFAGHELLIRALKPGTTTITLSGYNNTELVTTDIKVTVKDPVSNIRIEGAANIFVGAETRYVATATSASGALMDVPFEWESSNTSVATVNSEGVVEGVAEGATSITAKNSEIVSGARYLRVVAAPNAVSSPDAFQGFYEDENSGTDIVLLDANEGMLIIPGGYADGNFEGTYNLNGAYYMLNDARTTATGTVTITKGSDTDEYIVTMDVTLHLSDTNKVTFRFTNGSVYYLPA
jgi:bacterial surface proteins containing Ig-like domains